MKRCSSRETVPKQRGKHRETEERSNLGGAPTLREPWTPRTSGGTLLPSRGQAKQGKEGGGLSPPLSRWRRSAAGGTIVTAIISINFAAVINIFLPLYAAVYSLSPHFNPYLNMLFDAIYYYPMMCCICIMSE